MYTQCPACNTLFRITEQQLAAAKGKVRCGQCNYIYNAQGTLSASIPSEHISTSETATDNNTSRIPVDTEKPTTPIIETEEVLDIIAQQNLADVSDASSQDIDLTNDAIADFNEEEDDSISPPRGVDKDDWKMVDLGSYEEDEDDLLFDDDHGLAESSDIDSSDESSDDISYDESADEEDDDDLMRHVSDYLDEDAAEEMISEENVANILDEVNEQLAFSIDAPRSEEKSSTSVLDLPGDWLDDFDTPLKTGTTSTLLDDEEKDELNDAILKSVEQPFTSVEEKKDEAEIKEEPLFAPSESIVLESDQLLVGQHDSVNPPVINDAVPLRLRDSIDIVPQVPRSALKWLLIFSSIVGLSALLILQAVLFRSTDLAGMLPEWQPVLASVCEKLPCRDSSRKAVDQIQLMSRNISQHPKVKTALLIKAAILNRASFAQRYPNIQITLSDLTGSTVAQRTFTPAEYLGSLYNPFLQMKPGKPVHIALEVLDPGNTAINFEFKFL